MEGTPIIWEGNVYRVESAPRQMFLGDVCDGCGWSEAERTAVAMSGSDGKRFLWCEACIDDARAHMNHDKANGKDEYANDNSVPCDECAKVTRTLLTFGNTAICPTCWVLLSVKHGYTSQ